MGMVRNFWAQLKQPDRSARRLLSPGQQIGLIVLILLTSWFTLRFGLTRLAQLFVAISTGFIVLNVAYKCLLWRAGNRPLPNYGVADVNDPTLPRYTIFVPMLKETKETVLNLVSSIQALQYPSRLLQVLLVVEESDLDTPAAISAVEMPGHFETVVVPEGGPQTKPNALNYAALRLLLESATGEKATIYDAEDRMSPRQLLMAVAAFRTLGKQVGCIQALLAFWNQRSSFASAILGAEYTAHFCRYLNGLDRLGLVPPLGGTSNHFDVEALRKVAWTAEPYNFVGTDGRKHSFHRAWDPWNLTEDATMAYALYEHGYSTHLIRSFTYEEAIVSLRAGFKQGRRWLGGYLQTLFVHTRAPIRSIRRDGLRQWTAFNWFVASAPLSYLLNPILVGLTLTYLVSRVTGHTSITTFIQHLYPGPVFYPAVISMLLGNAILFAQLLRTPQIQQEIVEASGDDCENAHAEQRTRQMYGRTLPLFLVPLWWWVVRPLSAYSASWMLFKSLLTGKPPGWDKTAHGEVDETFAAVEAIQAPAEAELELRA